MSDESLRTRERSKQTILLDLGERSAIKWDEAERFVDLIAGEPDPTMTWQIFDDKKKHPEWAQIRHGRLSDENIRDWLADKNSQGCGVYVTVSRTDGNGRRRANITAARAAWADFDGEPLPESWPLEPDIITESSLGRFQVFWLTEPDDNLNAASDLQARLAAFYNTDPSIIDPARVCRVPGFYHQKAAPFRSSIVKSIEPREARIDDISRRTSADVEIAHPCDYRASSPRASTSRSATPEGGWDNPADVTRARRYLLSAPPSIDGERGNDVAFKTACRLIDFGISPETSLELMWEDWNERCEPPWTDEELDTIIHNANRYRQNDAGSESIAALVSADCEAPVLNSKNDPMLYDQTELPGMLDFAEQRMLAANAPLYQMGGRLVHPVRLDRDSATMTRFAERRVRLLYVRSQRFAFANTWSNMSDSRSST